MNQYRNYRTAPHPFFRDKLVKLPSDGKLKWLGGNLGIDTPVYEDVIDSEGKYHPMRLQELLDRLEEFEGFVGEMPIQQYLMDSAFQAYEHSLLNEAEATTFESYVNAKLSSIDKYQAVKRMLTT